MPPKNRFKKIFGGKRGHKGGGGGVYCMFLGCGRICLPRRFCPSQQGQVELH